MKDVKEEALKFFQKLRQMFRGWNSSGWMSGEFKKFEEEISSPVKEKIKP